MILKKSISKESKILLNISVGHTESIHKSFYGEKELSDALAADQGLENIVSSQNKSSTGSDELVDLNDALDFDKNEEEEQKSEGE